MKKGTGSYFSPATSGGSADPRPPRPARAGALVFIKSLHTVAWAVFAGCILALPLVAWFDRYDLALWSFLIVLGEVFVLALNRWTCPLTPIAARYTDERQPNFDIYLPMWLAEHNKVIFGGLYIAGIVFAGVRYWMKQGG